MTEKRTRTPGHGSPVVRAPTHHPDRDVRITKGMPISDLTLADPDPLLAEWPRDPPSGVHETQEAMVESRTKRTLAAANASAGASTASYRILKDLKDDLKRELSAHAEADLTAQGDVRLALTSLGERIDGALTQFVEAFQKTQIVTMTAKVEVDKHQQIATIEDTRDEKKFKRELIIKVVAIATPIIGILTTAFTLLISRC